TSFGKIAAGAFGILLSLAIGLWTDILIRDLFTRADWLVYAALAVLAVGILAILALVRCHDDILGEAFWLAPLLSLPAVVAQLSSL
ncbi:TIGR01620 family protein, partial [Rhizobium ruizarguesonis]